MAFLTTFPKSYNQPINSGLPVAHSELADKTGTAATVDTGIVGLKYGKIRIVIKSGLANTNSAIFELRVGTNNNLTAPEVVWVSPSIVFRTGDTNLIIEGQFASAAGFQSWQIRAVDTGGTAAYDVMFDAE